jgi:hypothetical protein
MGAADATLLQKHEKLKKRVELLERTIVRLEEEFRSQQNQAKEPRTTQSIASKDVGSDLIALKKNFEERTRRHIGMVQRNISLLAQANEELAGQLSDRGSFLRKKILNKQKQVQDSMLSETMMFYSLICIGFLFLLQFLFGLN